MRSLGHGLLVCVAVCLGFLPAQTEAATISFGSNPALISTTDVAFAPFTIDSSALLTGEITAGFLPVLTLFGPEADNTLPTFEHAGIQYQMLSELGSFDGTIILDPAILLSGAHPGTNYLLAISQEPVRFSIDLNAFETPADDFFAELTQLGCGSGFLHPVDIACGSGEFSASLTLESVPEPGALLLGAIAGAACAARRRLRRSRRP
jgi:hypothetical protein